MPECPHCNQSKAVKKSGSKDGEVRYLCTHCTKYFFLSSKYHMISDKDREEIIKMYANGVGIREIAEIKNRRHSSIQYIIKKNAQKL